MRRSLVDRYRESHGSGKLIWDELQSFGNLVEKTPDWEEAYGVALETMKRARVNVERIIQFLREQGYLFGYRPTPYGEGDPPWVPPAPDVTDQLQHFARLVGPLPVSLRAWWEVVGYVSLQGTFERDTDEYDGLPLTDPLMIRSLSSVLRQLSGAQPLGGLVEDGIAEDGRPQYLFDIAPDLYFKAKASGGLPYAVRLPDSKADVRVMNVCILLPAPPNSQHSCHGTALDELFVEYLRRSFRWAGFPAMAFWRSPEVERLAPLFEQMIPI